MVNVLALNSDDPSSNPTEDKSFFFKICVPKERNEQKGPGLAQLKVNIYFNAWL